MSPLSNGRPGHTQILSPFRSSLNRPQILDRFRSSANRPQILSRFRSFTKRSQILSLPRYVLAVLILGLALAGCRGDGTSEDLGYDFKVGISPTPPTVGTARLIISLHDPDGVPVEGAQILVEGNMSHAGMVPVQATAREDAPGQYSVSAFTFTMAGDWVLDLTASLPDGTIVKTRHPSDVVGPVGGGG